MDSYYKGVKLPAVGTHVKVVNNCAMLNKRCGWVQYRLPDSDYCVVDVELPDGAITTVISHAGNLVPLYESFVDDEEKMRDFFKLSREEFLNSYRYLTEEEYEATLEILRDSLENRTKK